MLEQLFGSNTRVEMLRLFFRSPADSFYVREITRTLDTQINAVRRELQLLVEANIVIEAGTPSTIDPEEAGAKLRKYFRVNTASNLYTELEALIVKEQVLEEKSLINEIVDKGGDITFFLITGTFTNNMPAPADLLIVGATKQRKVERLIAEYEKKHDVEIMYSMMPESEFFERRHMMDKFIYSMFESDHIKVIDKLSQR